ncbi:MAG TPA: MBL fold metallo-hydrolase [bacterium]|nr:MBL fold metallo-hydrolase [bacterium]
MFYGICTTCGTQLAPSDRRPVRCPICDEERQYVNWHGQAWVTMEDLRRDHRNVIGEEEPGLTGIRTEPSFAIGQRALLVQTPAGNILWDCVSLIDDETAETVRRLGGLAGIAISHPHYYSSMVDWSATFGGVPIYLHTADRAWVMRADSSIVYWDGDTLVLPGGLTLLRCGGHFPGAAVLHWPGGAGGRGALLTGDTLQVVPDRRWVSFMYSYPNLIPLDAATVRRIARAVAGFRFDRIYGAFAGRVIASGAAAAVQRSADRYVRAVEG